jgi:Flp pilus assembly protein TadG
MIALARLLRRVARRDDGVAAIETALVAPILLCMALGGYEVSSMVVRQSELQSAAAEAMNIVQASPPSDAAARTAIRNVLKASTGITDNNDATVVEIYRCATDTAFVTDKDDCDTGEAVSTYIQVTLKDTYSPSWTQFGVGHDIDYDVVRTVQIS